MADAPVKRRIEQVRWDRFIDVVTVAWLGVFVVVMLHADYPVLDLVEADTVRTLDSVLLWMTVLFIMDLVLQFRWSGLPLGRFLRRRWFDVLMAIPFMRPLRALRIVRVGRLARLFKVVSRSRNLLSLARKSRRALKGTRRGHKEPVPVVE